MTAAVYRWFLGLSGAGLVAAWCCAICILVGLAIAGAEYMPPAWRWSRRKLARWRAEQVRAANTPTRFEDRDATAGSAALVVTVVISALIAVVIWGTR